ncbi:hypothetical protein WJX84_002965 [Apatococcus fuscideae]|uniref:Uncharacterized protein n=1 Tax=Apatococcus fuscideae TaxID=2026836 RepID=A0AAW1S4U0_9CHLO
MELASGRFCTNKLRLPQSLTRLRKAASASCHSPGQRRAGSEQRGSRHRTHAASSLSERPLQTQAQNLLTRADDVQRLQQYSPLSSLPGSHVLALVQRAQLIELQAGDLVSAAGQPATALLILRDGTLKKDPTHQGSGIDGIIGLREILLGANFTQSIRADSDVVLWRITKADLNAVVAQYPDLGLHLYAAATKQLTALTEDLQDDIQQREALRAYSVTSPKVGIIGSSRYAKRLRTQVTQAAQDPQRHHVMIFGEPGLEKDTIAALIHFGSSDRRKAMGGTLLLTNVHQAPTAAKEQLASLMTSGTYYHLPAAPKKSKGPGSSSASTLDSSKEQVETSAGQKGSKGADADLTLQRTSARIIVTTEQALPFPAACKMQQIKVPPLRVRPTDVADLQQFLMRQAARRRGLPRLTLTPTALRQLESYNYPNNIQELESMVERAATQASDFGAEIPDSVFWFATKAQDRLRFNLFKGLPELKQFLRSDWWPEKINHGFTVWIYPAYVALLLWGPQDPSRNFGISLFWNYWWPVIFLVYPFLGRVWCSVCPFMIYGEVVQRWRLAQGAVLKKWPRQLSQQWGPWFLFALFLAILVWEEVWDLPHSPYLSAWLLLIITAGAMVCSWIFERRLWCRYLCPIGGMNALFAKLSVTELRARQGVCHSNCATYHCYKGGPAEPPEGLQTNGCPLHSHPAQLTDNADCVLCMECLKACPHGSVEFRLRPPGIDLWTSHTPSASELALQFMLLGAVFVHHLPAVYQQVGLDPTSLDGTLPHCLASFLLLSLPALLALGAHGVTHYVAFLQLAYAYLPLVWAGTLTHYLPAFLLRAGRILPVTARTVYADKWAPFQPESLPELAADPAVTVFLQGACLAFGTVASLVLLRKLGGRPWLELAPHCILTLAFAAELWTLAS